MRDKRIQVRSVWIGESLNLGSSPEYSVLQAGQTGMNSSCSAGSNDQLRSRYLLPETHSSLTPTPSAVTNRRRDSRFGKRSVSRSARNRTTRVQGRTRTASKDGFFGLELRVRLISWCSLSKPLIEGRTQDRLRWARRPEESAIACFRFGSGSESLVDAEQETRNTPAHSTSGFFGSTCRSSRSANAG